MQAIILAAGTGSRLEHLTESIPKALVKLANKPLLAYSINFAKWVGCDQIIVVVGAYADKVKYFLQGLDEPNLTIVENKNYLIGNLYSLGAARNQIEDDFLLLNTDHVYKQEVAERIQTLSTGVVAFCDNDRKLGTDDMKVESDHSGYLVKISKQLEQFDWGYVGMTFCAKKHHQDYFDAFDTVAKTFKQQAVVEAILGELANRGKNPKIGDISQIGWLEIDTPSELQAAEEVLAKRPESFLTQSKTAAKQDLNEPSS